MSCQEMENLVHAYMDDELDLVGSLEVERHLQSCADCSRAYRELVGLRDAIRSNTTYFAAPASLRRNLELSMRPRRTFWWQSVAAVAAGLAVFAVLLWKTPGGTADEELVADHIRSLMSSHLTDVPSTDQHTVKPWFSGKLDFSPVVKDFAEQGFRLIGGRLDYLGNRAVAAIVYQRRQHVINVFTWPAPGAADRAASTTARQGYNTASWVRAGMSYSAVSDLNAKELGDFVRLLQ